jgi:hypothetical protein
MAEHMVIMVLVIDLVKKSYYDAYESNEAQSKDDLNGDGDRYSEDEANDKDAIWQTRCTCQTNNHQRAS